MNVKQISMNQLITDNIDTWTSTVKTKATTGRGSSKKRELYGVKKLRELILELAVRGKLVPQDPTDEPASYFFPEMEEEKSALVKANKLKKQKPTPLIDGASAPYQLPAQWVWMGLPDVTFFQEGPGILAKDFRDAGVPLIRISGMHEEKVSLAGCNFLDESMVLKKWEHFKLDLEDIVLSSSASLGKVAKVSEETVGAIVYTGLIRFKTYAALSENYMSRFFESMEFARQINSSKTGAAIKHFGPTHLKKMVIPIPPLKEQHRIVTKVDELMTLCDQLEQQTEASIEAHQTLVEVLLNTLTSSENADELMQNWDRISDHFDTLFTTEASIDLLKQTILQLAVMGKLVPQDLNDEPAAKLLERIAEEKAQLIKEKKIKKQKALPPITDDEKPFELPNGWCIERLGNICEKMGSGSTPRGGQSAYVAEGIPFLRSQNVWNGELKLNDIAYIPKETHDKMENTKVYPGDVLLNITGASLGRSTVFPVEIPEANVSQHVTIIRLIEPSMKEFVHLGIVSPLIQSLVWGRQVGMAIEGLSKKVLEQFEFPVPPLEEQKRICVKVDELMDVCEQLKFRLKDSQITQLHLTDAFVDLAL
ncbi:Type I restriction enzyme EcoAI specificity subunit [Vibrio crassostreae]|nr:Type I restriction enzyme EcoAI specificity subunit [Vibrio crassostreae]